MNKSDTTTVEKVDGRDARLNLLRKWTKTTRQPAKETVQQTKGKKQQKDRHNNTQHNRQSKSTLRYKTASNSLLDFLPYPLNSFPISTLIVSKQREMFHSLCGFGVSFYMGLRAKMQRLLSELSRAGEKAKESMYTTLTKLHESMTVSQSQSHPSTKFLIT